MTQIVRLFRLDLAPAINGAKRGVDDHHEQPDTAPAYKSCNGRSVTEEDRQSAEPQTKEAGPESLKPRTTKSANIGLYRLLLLATDPISAAVTTR